MQYSHQANECLHCNSHDEYSLIQTENARATNKDNSKCLSILDTPKGLFLAWVTNAISGNDTDVDEGEFCAKLGI